MRFSFGTDPELMLSKDGKIYSAIGIIKGTKERRKKIGKHAFYYDNVLAECAVAPANSKAEAVENIKDCLGKYAKLVSPYILEPRASHYFSKDQLKHPEAMKISCFPETCVYKMEDVEVDSSVLKKTDLRTAGGHVHLGSEILRGCNRYVSVLLLDLFLGLPSIYLDNDPTTKERKKLYGQAGRHRTPIYGVEYRTIGNFWLTSPKLVEFTYDICDLVLNLIENDKWQSLWEVDEERLESDDAYLDPNYHPAQCYKCVGYDVDKLRLAIDTSDRAKGQEFLSLSKEFNPARLCKKIS